MTAIPRLLLLATVIPLTMTGVEIAIALVDSVLWTFPPSQSVPPIAAIARRFGKLMPPWYIVSTLLALADTWFLRSSPDARLCCAVAAGLFVLAILFSVLGLVPINNRIAAAQDSPDDLLTAHRLWNQHHLLRTLTLLAANVLLLLAFTCL